MSTRSEPAEPSRRVSTDRGAIGIVRAAEYTNTSPSFIRNLIRRGQLPSVRLGRRVLIRLEAIDDLLSAASRSPSASQTATGDSAKGGAR
jgi:excisionase family DNA binding protein